MRHASMLFLLALGCATSSKTEHLTYEPNPANAFEPAQQVQRIIEANPNGSKVSVSFDPAYFTVRSKNESGSTQQTVAYARASNVGLVKQTTDGVTGYAVLVTDVNLRIFFQWPVKSLEEAQALSDAIAALALPK